MRKLWGGASSSANSHSSSPPPQPDKPSPFVSFIKSGKPSWPSGESPLPSPTTPGLFIKKDRKQSSVASFSEIVANGSGNLSRRSDFLTSPPISPTQSTLSPSSRKPVQNSTPLIPPVAGPSSPAAPLSSSLPPRNPVPSEWNRTSDLSNVRDDLLISLLTSEAVVDSRDCKILNGEEVEELKREHQILNSRLTAAQKKLKLESKIRDAALSLSKLSSTHDKLPNVTNDQLEVAERRVDVAQTDFWRISERAGEVERKLLEHRVGVLGYSVMKMDTKTMLKDVSGANTPNRVSALSSVTTTLVPSKERFDGAHLFAGHVDAQIPKAPPAASDITSLEDKLRTATEALSAANQDIAVLKAELEDAKNQREAVIQDNLAELNALHNELDDAREDWEAQRVAMEESNLAELGIMQDKLQDAREDWEAKKAVLEENKLAELGALQDELEDTRARWEAEKVGMEEKLAGLDTLQNELEDAKAIGEARADLDEATEALRTMVQLHGIAAPSGSTLQDLLSSVRSHLEQQSLALQDYSDKHVRLEDELQVHMRKNEALSNDLDIVRQERDNARLGILSLESRAKELADAASSASHDPPVEYKGEVADVIAILQPIWQILPPPELRAAMLSNARHLRNTSGTSTPGASPTKSNLPSLSDMDVRALKSLYDARSRPVTPAVEQSKCTFAVEAFVARVEALIVDDRALIERLIHLAQAHDLLKKNAERAQKLVHDSNTALQTYQRQVTTLESQHISDLSNQSALMDEIRELQDAVERAVTEKREMEMHAADQAEMCRQLAEANNALSAKMLTLAEEAAAAPEKVRQQLEGQLAECREALRKAREEVEVMRSSEQTQRVALLDELNSMQMEHDNLRAQLRAVKK